MPLPEIEGHILAGLDAHMQDIFTLYDISKALPHPYDAFNDQSRRMLHDFAGLASSISSYIEVMRNNRQEES